MDPASMVIKIKGLSAVSSLSSQSPLVGVVKLKGMAAGTGVAAAKLGEIEIGKVIATKKGLLLTELEADCLPAITKVASGKAVIGKAAVTKAAVAKGATQGALTGSKAVYGTGAALAAKSAGWSLGLGGLGPWLALGALGLAATGIYLYLRAQQSEDALQDPDEFESPV